MNENTISDADARAMVRLLGSVAALEGGHQVKKRALMNGLCELIEAESWVWTLGCMIEPGQPQVYVNYLHDGFDDKRFAKLLKGLEHPIMGKVVEPFYTPLAETGMHTTMLRQEIDPQGLFYKSSAKQLWADANIGPLMLSGYPLDDQSLSAIAIYRTLDAPQFSDREKHIAHIILHEVPWLHLAGWPEDRGAKVPQLYPRQRIVLNLLLDGLGRKQIAAHMNISENTVSGYVKDIYRHFEVNSQAELIHKFCSGHLPPA